MKETDEHGNKLLIGQDGIYLKLKSENKMREIFKIRNTTVEKYVSRKNIFRKIGEKGAIGLNYNALKIIQEKMKIKKIAIRVGGGKPKLVSIKDIFDRGIYLRFLQLGFELQVFCPMELLND